MPQDNEDGKRYTSIPVTRAVRDELNALKIIPQEPWDKLLSRLMHEHDD
jgi:hypothetical protein